VLQYVAVCCSVLQCVAECWTSKWSSSESTVRPQISMSSKNKLLSGDTPRSRSTFFPPKKRIHCVFIHMYMFECTYVNTYMHIRKYISMSSKNKLRPGDKEWLRFVGSLKWQVSFGKEPYKRDHILQKRSIILRSLVLVATPYTVGDTH